jgi:hypothetical protein
MSAPIKLYHFWIEGDLYVLADSLDKLFPVLSSHKVNVLDFNHFWFYRTPDKYLQIYVAWDLDYADYIDSRRMRQLSKCNNHPVSRFIHVVGTKEDLFEFDWKLPPYLNNVDYILHLPGCYRYGYHVTLVYPVCEIYYGWIDYYFGWLYR